MYSIYNPNNIRHTRRTRIINTIKNTCNLYGYTYTNGLHTIFNTYATQHLLDKQFTLTYDNYIYRAAYIEEQVTKWVIIHFTQ